MNLINKTIIELEYYNKWRRGKDTKQPCPTKLGLTIDNAIKLLKEYEQIKNR